MSNDKSLSLFDPALVRPAVIGAFTKLDPRVQWRNPVMFVVYIGAILTTGLWIQALFSQGEAPAWFIVNVAVWLWFTLLFANFAEALAEGRRIIFDPIPRVAGIEPSADPLLEQRADVYVLSGKRRREQDKH